MLDECKQGEEGQTFAGHVASTFYYTWVLEAMMEVGARSSLQLKDLRGTDRWGKLEGLVCWDIRE